ncbi:MAG TPA: pilus assembly protein TadG-related protein [Candidatus Binatia bacterium]|nr:pilus assembly protein TadG-related protein [Candidatus Binatia bacterium]
MSSSIDRPAHRFPARAARPRRSDGESGQAIVVMLGAILLSVALVATIVDGGNVFAQQRVTQNGVDAAAEAGAVLLAERLAGANEPSGGWDINIAVRILQVAEANGITVQAAYYTDICGIPLKADGSAAIDTDSRKEDLAAALQVGNGAHILPGGAATAPDCPNRLVGPVAGVMVVGEKEIAAYIAGAIGINTFLIRTRATAVAGYIQSYCDASEGKYCALLPVAFPTSIIVCNGSNKPLDTGEPWKFGIVYKIPLCQASPGNVGYLDWDPPAGGTGEVVCSILTADNPAIDLPSWQYVTATGNSNGGGGKCGMSIEEAIRTYDGKTVLVPQFDLSCNPSNGSSPDSTEPAVITPPNYGCPSGALGGNGSNQWYRMPSFAFLQLCSPSTAGCGGLHGAYISGNNSAICDAGNGATSCLVARFVHIMATGTVGAGVGSGTGNKAVGVQLIK